MTPQTRALIEAAEKIEWITYPDPNIGDVTFCPCCRNEQERGHNKGCQLAWAISSAKAAEEGVEKAYVVEVRSPRKYGANWDSPFDSLADAEAYVASTHSLDSMCSIIRIETRRVREKEGL